MLQLSNLELTRVRRGRDRAEPAARTRRARRATRRRPAPAEPGSPEPDGTRSTLSGAARPGGIGEVAGDAAEHWEAAVGREGDGSRSTAAGEGDLGGSRGRGRPRRRHRPGIEQTAARSAQPARAPDRADRRRSSRPGRPAHCRCICSISSTRPAICASISTRPPERLGCATAQVERVLARAAAIRPARRLRAQSRRMPGAAVARPQPARPGDAASARNLPLLAARNVAALMRVCEVDAEDLADMIAEIRSLDPRPGHCLRRAAAAAGRSPTS